jgi:hypothetical protein
MARLGKNLGGLDVRPVINHAHCREWAGKKYAKSDKQGAEEASLDAAFMRLGRAFD